MSGFGGQGKQQARELLEIVRELTGFMSDFGHAVSDATTATSSNTNAAKLLGDGLVKAAKNFGKDVGFGVAGDIAKFGGDVSVGNSLASNILRAGSKLPIVGDIFGAEEGPLEAAGNRTLGVTGAIARAGGKVDPAGRRAIFNKFLGQERAAQGESLEVERMQDAEAPAALERYSKRMASKNAGGFGAAVYDAYGDAGANTLNAIMTPIDWVLNALKSKPSFR